MRLYEALSNMREDEMAEAVHRFIDVYANNVQFTESITYYTKAMQAIVAFFGAAY